MSLWPPELPLWVPFIIAGGLMAGVWAPLAAEFVKAVMEVTDVGSH